MLAARVVEPASGRIMEVLTTEPGVQVYTGNYLDGTLVGTGGKVYRRGMGCAWKPSTFQTLPNRPSSLDPTKSWRGVPINDDLPVSSAG